MRKTIAFVVAGVMLACSALAQNNSLPTPATSNPEIAYTHSLNSNPYGLGSYVAAQHAFSTTGVGISVAFPATKGFCGSGCPSPVMNLAIQVDNAGKLIGGNPTAGQPDFVLNGQITNGRTIYTSPLLTGTVTEFYFDGVNNTSNFAFRIAVSGGSMAPLYLQPPSLNNDLWMVMTLENLVGVPNFAGSFGMSFGGQSKGMIYGTPGACHGSIGDFVWNDLNANGIQDGSEPGLDGVTLQLHDNANNVIATTMTGAGPTGPQHGYYQFTGVCAGTYFVTVDETTLPKGSDGKIHFEPTMPNAPASTTANDSNPNPAPVVLTSNASVDNTIDFGYIALQGALGDYVWYDANRDGLQEPGEPGINGVLVNLYASDGITLLATTTTSMGGPNNVNGYYQFTGLDEGTYVVAVDSTTLPPNYSPTDVMLGSNPALDSNGSPATVTLASDSSVDETIDFGYVTPCNGTIGDFVWHDLNLDGLQAAGEPGITGVSLSLYDSTHKLIQSATTDANGNYLFSGVCAGSYEVIVDASTLPPNFTPTTPHAGADQAIDSNGSPAPVTLKLDSSNNVASDLTIDFGYVSPCNGTIGDFVWNDLNANGTQDAGEPGINNVLVQLFDAQNHLLSSAITHHNGTNDGYYQFTGLCPASYHVQVSPPAGFYATTVNAPNSNTADDSNPNPAVVTLAIVNSNGDITTDESIDFGFYQISSTCVVINAVQGTLIVPVKVTASGGVAPYSYAASGLPDGLTMASDGTISGTPTATGTFQYTVTTTDSNGNTSTSNCSITVIPPLTVKCGVNNIGEVGLLFDSGPMQVTGGTAPYTFSIIGTLPAGLTLNPSTGEVIGTPTAGGSFTVKVTDSNGLSSTSCQITINSPLTVSCGANSIGEVGVVFSSGPMQVSGGTGPYIFSIVGTLPAGLSLNTSTGEITGTATASGSFSVKVMDASGVSSTNCNININPPLTVSCGANSIGEVGVLFDSGPMQVTGGAAPYTFSIIRTLPPGLTLNPSTGAITGTATASGSFTVKVTDAGGATSTTCNITINPPLIVQCGTNNIGEVGVLFDSGPMHVNRGTAT